MLTHISDKGLCSIMVKLKKVQKVFVRVSTWSFLFIIAITFTGSNQMPWIHRNVTKHLAKHYNIASEQKSK